MNPHLQTTMFRMITRRFCQDRETVRDLLETVHTLRPTYPPSLFQLATTLYRTMPAVAPCLKLTLRTMPNAALPKPAPHAGNGA